MKWNKITRRKHLASPCLWTRSGSPSLTLRWLRKTKSCSFCVSDHAHKWELANASAAHQQFLLEEGASDLSTPAVYTIYIPLKDLGEEIRGLHRVRLLLDPLSSSDGACKALFCAITHEDISWRCQILQYDRVFHNLSYFPFKPQPSVLCSYTRTSAFIKEKETLRAPPSSPSNKKKKKPPHQKPPNQTKKAQQSNNEMLQKPPPLFRHMV